MRYGTSYGEWVTGNILGLVAVVSVISTAVGGIGTGIDVINGESLFVDGRTDWSEIALGGLVGTLIFGTMSFRHDMDQESRRSIMGVVFPRGE